MVLRIVNTIMMLMVATIGPIEFSAKFDKRNANAVTVSMAKKAKQKNIPVIGLAGKIPLQPEGSLKKFFEVLLPINNEPSSEKMLQHTKDNLIRTAMEIGDLLSLKL